MNFMLLVEMNILTNGISLIEWGEMIEEILPSNYIKIIIEKDLENTSLRYFNIETHGDKFNNLFDDFNCFERIL